MKNKGRIVFITGGARSGKSRYAQEQALQLANNPIYVATARVLPEDEAFKVRVGRHIADRDQRWTSMEEPFQLSRLVLQQRVVVIDCVTLWLSNFFIRLNEDEASCLKKIREEVDELRKTDAQFFIISNEIGMGVHAATESARKFTDLQGWTNQYIAGLADQVILMVSGIPLILKNNLLK